MSSEERVAFTQSVRNEQKELANLQRRWASLKKDDERRELQAIIRERNRELSNRVKAVGFKTGALPVDNPSEIERKPSPALSQAVSFKDAQRMAISGDFSRGAVQRSQGTGREPIRARVPPQFAAPPKTGEVQTMFGNVPGMRPAPSIIRSEYDPRSEAARVSAWVAGGSKGAKPVSKGFTDFVTNIPTPVVIGQDEGVLSFIQQLPKGQWEKDTEQQYLDTISLVIDKYYSGSGPLQGWYKRILWGKKHPKPTFSLTLGEMAEALKALPFRASYVPDMRKLTLEDALDKIKVNMAAHSGLPRNAKKG
jgi:hypothetical protein